MSKENVILSNGEVVEALSNGFFKVKLDDDDREIMAHLSGKMRIHYIKVLTGDKVSIELSDTNADKGRITRRF